MYTAAIPALSVGVNQPLKMPPRMITGRNAGPMTRTTALPSIEPSNGRVMAILGCSRTQTKMYRARPTRHQHGRQDRTGEQGAGGDGCRRREEDRGDARRHHRAHQRAGRREPRREPVRVAGLEHLRDLHLARRRGVRERGTADPREPDRGAEVDVGEVAGEPRKQRPREVVEPRRDAEMVGDRADEDEQRDGEQREAVDAVHDRRDRVARRQAVAVEVQHARRDHREGDGHPQQQEDDEQQDIEPEIQELSLPFRRCRACARGGSRTGS